FIFFVMAFPSAIVVMFFFILWIRPTALYAPSDYDDPEHFLDANRIRESAVLESGRFVERFVKNKKEISEKNISQAVQALRDSVIQPDEEGLEERLVAYLEEHPREAFTDRALGHILVVGRRSVRESLASLQERGVVAQGVEPETGLTLWQIKR
ncbi:MAG: hypothetical protein ACQET4_13845, partial [Pseudomonadota bacterium]